MTQDISVLAPGQAPIQPPLTVHIPLNDSVVVDEPPPSNSILSAPPTEPPGFESVPLSVSAPPPVPLHGLTYVNGCRTNKPSPIFEPNQDFDADIIGDDLDDLLDQAGPESLSVSWCNPTTPKRGLFELTRDVSSSLRQDIPTMKGPLPLPTSIASGSSMSNPFLMPPHINPFLSSSSQQCTVNLPPLYHKSGSSSYLGMDTFQTLPPPLDSLDSLTIADYKAGQFLYIQEFSGIYTLKCVFLKTCFSSLNFRFYSISLHCTGNFSLVLTHY